MPCLTHTSRLQLAATRWLPGATALSAALMLDHTSPMDARSLFPPLLTCACPRSIPLLVLAYSPALCPICPLLMPPERRVPRARFDCSACCAAGVLLGVCCFCRNAAALAASGAVLLAVADDFIPPRRYPPLPRCLLAYLPRCLFASCRLPLEPACHPCIPASSHPPPPCLVASFPPRPYPSRLDARGMHAAHAMSLPQRRAPV